jgi:Family of unknown function (DUF6152)
MKRAAATLIRRSLLPWLFVCAPALAHHSFPVQYDANQPVTIKGWITKVEWTNPHVYFYMDVEDEQGEVESWAFEMVAPIVLERRGWTRNTLAVGEFMEVQGFLARDGSRLASAASLYIERTGQRFSGTTRQEVYDDKP